MTTKKKISNLFLFVILILATFIFGVIVFRLQKSFADRKMLKDKKPLEHQITIPEGWTVKQMDDYFGRKKLLSRGEFFRAAKEKEGFLFPDTYRLSERPNTEEIIGKMQENFLKKTAQFNPSRETIILASIIEKEVQSDEDRPIVAGIFQRRLENNMFLESCATVNYALGTNKKILSRRDLETDSAYNTYRSKGLPPAPIGNPGLAAIKAALEPAETDYLYFLTGKDNKTYFAKTKEEHDANKKKYL